MPCDAGASSFHPPSHLDCLTLESSAASQPSHSLARSFSKQFLSSRGGQLRESTPESSRSDGSGARVGKRGSPERLLQRRASAEDADVQGVGPPCSLPTPAGVQARATRGAIHCSLPPAGPGPRPVPNTDQLQGHEERGRLPSTPARGNGSRQGHRGDRFPPGGLQGGFDWQATSARPPPGRHLSVAH